MVDSNIDTWNPIQYQKFENERTQPFFDLIKLIQPRENLSILDLGCGTGKLTEILHNQLHAKNTVGLDNSHAMISECRKLETASLVFKQMAIQDFSKLGKFDLIFSNAALQWIDDHQKLFALIRDHLNSHGQLAVQMPNNFDYPSHKIAEELAKEKPFCDYIPPRDVPILDLSVYSEMLYQLGFKDQLVKSQVYPHLLESTHSVIEWVKGSLLTYYKKYLSPEKYEQFEKIYSKKIELHFGMKAPFFMPFTRIFIWGKL